MPIKVGEMIKILEADGWFLKRTTGSLRHFVHLSKPGLVTVAGGRSEGFEAQTAASILRQAGLGKEQQ